MNFVRSMNFLKYLVLIFFFLGVAAVFIPLKPENPEIGLDHSWAFAVNQAVSQNLVFGRDFLFSYGPYAAVSTKLYHPRTDHLMMFGSVLLALCYSFLWIILSRGRRFYWIAVYGAFLPAWFASSREVLFLSYPLILALVTYRLVLSSNSLWKLHISGHEAIGIAISFALLGLLPLIKISFMAIAAGIGSLCCFILWHRRERLLACLSIILPVFSAAFFWNFAGQRIVDLPRFFIAGLPLIFGYTEAMASAGSMLLPLLYCLTAALILCSVLSIKSDQMSLTLFCSSSYALFLFLAFKEGFVRQDGHVIVAAFCLVTAGLTLNLITDNHVALLGFAAALLVCMHIAAPYASLSVPKNIRSTYSEAWDGLRLRLAHSDALKKEFDKHVEEIAAKDPLPSLGGTTDTYSYHQSELLASANRWWPRPIVQSYSAYSPSLLRLNEEHLERKDSPDHVLFSVEPIDGRLPALEDGLSWPTLINNYRVTNFDMSSGLIYMDKKETFSYTPTAEVYTGVSQLGAELALPNISEPLLAQMNIRPTFLGRILSVLYKPPQLGISLRLRDGRKKTYRIVSTMAASWFLLSPLVQDGKDFLFLTASGDSYLKDNLVRSIQISVSGGDSLFWNVSYSIKLRKINLLGQSDVSKLFRWDRILASAPKALSVTSSESCDGNIDSINGLSPTSGSLLTSGVLSVDGWAAITAKEGVVPDAVFVTLTAENGRELYIKARRVPRDDVKAYFKQPQMSDPGFTIYADVSHLSGKYEVGFSRLYKASLDSCKAFKDPLMITPK